MTNFGCQSSLQAMILAHVGVALFVWGVTNFGCQSSLQAMILAQVGVALFVSKMLQRGAFQKIGAGIIRETGFLGVKFPPQILLDRRPNSPS